jgi:predicted nuclease of predicted toxin-antitoxin system
VRFLVDECTGPGVAQWLGSQGHDVFSAYHQSPSAFDEELLQRAVAENRILITNDKDFGEMIHRENRPHCGVVLLRLHNDRTRFKIDALDGLLAAHADQLSSAFGVVTDSQIRFAGG